MGGVTLERVEYLAMQLPAAEQKKLVARISEQLSESGVDGESPPIRSIALSLSKPPAGIVKIGEMADKSHREADKFYSQASL